MNQKKAITGVTKIYDSKQLDHFEQADKYPVGWEIIYQNDQDASKEFTHQLMQTIRELPDDKKCKVSLENHPIDKISCIEYAFDSVDTFRKVVNEGMKGFTFYNEEAQKVVPKKMMIDSASQIMAKKLAVAI